MISTRDRWTAGLIGALTCGMVGPEIGLLLMSLWGVCRSSSVEEAISMLAMPLLWPFAVIPFGASAGLLGGIGGVLLHSLADKSPSTRVANLEAGSLGLVLGAAVLVGPLLSGWGTARDAVGLLPLATSTGALCGLLVLWLFRRVHLLQQHENSPSLP
jgi:hypothetical protein